MDERSQVGSWLDQGGGAIAVQTLDHRQRQVIHGHVREARG